MVPPFKNLCQCFFKENPNWIRGSQNYFFWDLTIPGYYAVLQQDVFGRFTWLFRGLHNSPMWRRLVVNHVFPTSKPKLTSHKKKDPNHFRTVLLMISCFFFVLLLFSKRLAERSPFNYENAQPREPIPTPKKGSQSTFLGFASSVVGKKLSYFPNGGEKWWFLPSYYCWWLKFQTTTWEYLRCIKHHYLIYRINWWTPDFSHQQ